MRKFAVIIGQTKFTGKDPRGCTTPVKTYPLPLILLLLAACAGRADVPAKPPDPTHSPTPAHVPAPKTFLALGDSFTIGESVPAGERWPVQLTAALEAGGIPMAAPQLIARTGWTTIELANAIAASTLTPPYDLVTLLIGVNNQYRGYPQETYREEFAALLQQAITFAGGDPAHVIVVSIPDWGAVPFAQSDARGPAQITAEVEAFNAISRAETARLGAHYVDIFPASQLAYDDPTLIAPDRLHPSGEQYRLWVAEILPVAAGLLAP